MRSVNLSTLKAQLSAHIQLVRSGEEIVVRDRNRAIARIIPFEDTHHTEQQKRLIAKGILVPPKNGGRPIKLPKPVGKMISKEVVKQIWLEERGD